MELLPCSDIQYVGDSNCPQRSSSTNVMYNGEPNCKEHGNQVQELELMHTENNYPNAVWPQKDKLDEHRTRVDEQPTSEGICTETIDPKHGEAGKELAHEFHGSQNDSLNAQEQNAESHITFKKLYSSSDNINDALLNHNRDAMSCSLASELEDPDKSVALWVKWRGQWQAGIRCARADCPLSVLKARPTHDQKKYFVVFFPHTRNYSWADMSLVCPNNELPEPIAHRTHYQGLEKVKDLSLPRCFIIQKLAVGMLDIIDQLHKEAMIESAQQVTTWKKFAVEASHCKDYSDLGRMLLKLHNMILPQYINPGLLQHSIDSWIWRCGNAQSADTVEMLTEELVKSILWNEVQALQDAPLQFELDSEWRTWKKEVMKWFLISHPISNGLEEDDQKQCDDSVTVGLQVSRKRPKLEVRRAEMNASQLEASTLAKVQSGTIASGFFDSQRGNASTLVSESCEDITSTERGAPSDCPGGLLDRWDEIVVEAGTNEFIPTTKVKEVPADGESGRKILGSGNRYQQCQAFIEAKGRQCIRWANDGDVYCCVHLAIRSLGKTSKAELKPHLEAAMCKGTTTHGVKCKHRSQYGSEFCKKHRHQNLQDLMDAAKPSNSSENAVKRSHTEMITSTEIASCKEMPVGELQNPLQANDISVVGGAILGERNTLIEKPEESIKSCNSPELCIGPFLQHSGDICPERAKFHTLYCEKHIPSFLKRARNGKSRIISKEVFVEFLSNCRSQEQKLNLHKACMLLYGFTKSVLSRRNPVSKETQLQWILSEASKDLCVGQYIMKLVLREREKLRRLWNFDAESHKPCFSDVEESVLRLGVQQSSNNRQETVKCKICSKEFFDDDALGAHWMDVHKKEAQWLFRGYSCAICPKSFTNKKFLETHVKETHQMHFLDQSVLYQCMPCGNHFIYTEQLWLHVLSVHSMDLKLSSDAQQHNVAESQSSQQPELSYNVTENNSGSNGESRRFICKFCGLKFDLLPDLGRHHQAAHMDQSLVGHIPPRRVTNQYKLKSGRLIRQKFGKGLGTASYRLRNRGNLRMKKRFQASTLASSRGVRLQPQVAEVVGLGRLTEPQCSAVAKILFSEIQEAKPRPGNLDLLSVARSTCCKISLHAALEEKFGVLPDRLYLKAAKLCSELNIQVEWHQEGFICPKGCKPTKNAQLLPPLLPLSSGLTEQTSAKSEDPMNFDEWETDECHYVVETEHIKSRFTQTTIILCEDVSFGLESIPIPCVTDENTLGSLHINSLDERFNGNRALSPMPWESFTYVTKRLLDPSTDCDTKGSQLGCACPQSTCSPDACDHVYLFENDYENAKDILGEPMHGKFAYDEKGRIILEEGYLVYECNSRCSCDRTCRNRVLQNGVQVKLEVFKTEDKGWGVRAREEIACGTFVCEFIGEVSNDQEMRKREKRYEDEGCSYWYNVDAHVDEMSGLDVVPYVVNARNYGNVSRFINHSCSPNVIKYQVLVDSMDFQLAHIGFYASRDIAAGEELAYDYNNHVLSGEQPCLCGAPNCRGRLP